MSSRPNRGTARLAAILDALPDALLLVNSNGTVVDANSAAVRSLQAPGTSLVGRGVLSLLPEFDPSRIPGSMRPEGGADDDTAVRMTARRTDGSEFTVEVLAHEFEHDGIGFGLSGGSGSSFDSYGSISSYGRGSDRELLLITVRDLTARLEVEAELRRQHKQTEMILRAAAEGVVGVDNDGRVVLVNPAAAHLLGHRASELGGQELLPLVMHSRPDGAPLPPEESPLMDTLRSGRRHRVKNAVLWRKDGRPVPVELATAPVRDGEQLVGAVMTFSDRSAFRALTERHRQLGALLEHELRGPLDRLDETLEQLARDPAGQLWPEANWVLRRLADECRRTARLVDGVLEYQRLDEALERGTEQLDRRPVGLDRVVDQAVRAATELIGVGRVEFSVHPSPVELVVDEARLVDALAHLIADVAILDGTSTAAAGPHGLYGMAVGVASGLAAGAESDRTVVIAAAQRGEVARVEVRGPGQGGGVHLPLARGIVERHGGVLQAHELPGRQGVTYVVELPLDPDAAPVFRPPAPPRENATTLLPELPAELSGSAGSASSEPTGRQEREGQSQGGGQARTGHRRRGRPEQGDGYAAEAAPALPAARRAPEEDATAAPGAVDGMQGQAEGTDRSRRRNRLPEPEVIRPPRPQQEPEQSQADHPQGPDGSFPGLIGAPVYPGLEHALPPAGSAVVPERRSTGGRRRRLALGPAAGDESSAPAPDHDLSSAALQPAEPMAPAPLAPPAPMTPISQSWPSAPAHAGTPDQQESGSRESSTRTNGRGVQVSRSRHAAVQPFHGAPDVPAAGSGNTGVMSLAQSPLQAVQTPPQGVPLPALVPAAREESAGPRRLLVWPEPEPATEQALRARGFGPVLVSSREEVEAQAPTRPAALFVDPLTGPITRSALQTLRTASGDAEVPMLVTAGLGLAAPEAVYGADPAVLLRALAPRDSERHAPRVLLVEQDQDIAGAFTASLERRGMQVEHTPSENDAVSRASSVQPNLVVMDLMLIRRRRQGIIDWLRGSHRLYRTPLVVYTSVVDDREQRRGLSTGASMLFFAERSTSPEVQARIVDLLGKIASATEA